MASVVVALLFAIGLIGAVEVGLRLKYPEKLALPTGTAVLEPDSNLIYTLRPGLTAEFIRSAENGGQTIIWHANAQGFRGNPLRAGHHRRIVVFGDSNIQGVFSTQENTFAARLERQLSDATGTDVEVVNAGVMGYGPDQSLLYMRRRLAELKPDVVVFQVFADNDFGDLLRNRLFRDSAGTLVRHPSPFRYPRASRLARMQDFTASLLVVRATLKLIGVKPAQPPAARVPSDPAQYAQYLLRVSDHELAAYHAGCCDGKQVDHYDLDVASRPDQEPARTQVTLMADVLAAAQDDAARSGTKFLVLIEPSAVDLTGNLTLGFRNLAGIPGYRPDRLTTIIRDICVQRGIPYVNLFAPFHEAGPDTLYFRRDDTHWNDAGQALAARETAGPVLSLMTGAQGH